MAARASDPMALAHNPAGLAELRGNQMLLDLNIATMSACVDPAGYYGWGAYRGGTPSRLPDPQRGGTPLDIPLGALDGSGQVPAEATAYYTDPYDTVCLNQNIGPVPQLAFSLRLSDRLGVGFGLIFPSVQPAGSWGNAQTGIIVGDDGDLRPAATRYQMLVANNLGLFPNLGVGYRITNWLRAGVAIEYGYVAVDTTVMAAATGGTTPNNDLRVHVEGSDFFVPAVTSSIHIVPVDAIDFVVAFRWQDTIDAHGRADFTSGLFDASKRRNTSTVNIPSIQQNMPWKLRAGLRYANRRVPRPTTAAADLDASGDKILHDPMHDERWDVELDVEYQFNARNKEQFIDFVDGARIDFRPEGSAMVPNDITIQKRWQNQWSVRLGTTVNVVPGVFAISAGAHYETRGVDPAYMQVDFWPLSRVGLHTGITYRVSNAVDMNLSYAHIFQETLIVAAPPHIAGAESYPEYDETGVVKGNDKFVGAITSRSDPNGGQVLLEEPSQGRPDGVAALQQNTNVTSPGEPPYITNAGRYRSSFDIVAVGVNVHF